MLSLPFHCVVQSKIPIHVCPQLTGKPSHDVFLKEMEITNINSYSMFYGTVHITWHLLLYKLDSKKMMSYGLANKGTNQLGTNQLGTNQQRDSQTKGLTN